MGNYWTKQPEPTPEPEPIKEEASAEAAEPIPESKPLSTVGESDDSDKPLTEMAAPAKKKQKRNKRGRFVKAN